jgi:hypothetical protein
MRKTILLTLLLFSFFQISAQTTFKKGYIIDLKGQKSDCWIQNAIWDQNPDHFDYKLTESGIVQQGDTHTIQSFGIEGTWKYVRCQVGIDWSSFRLDALSWEKEVHLKEETLFLRVLIDGPVMLYQYKGREITRFFYNKGDSIQQLIYKEYLILGDAKKIGKVRHFQRQLVVAMDCGSDVLQRSSKMEYKEADLLRFYRQYYACTKESYTDYKPYNRIKPVALYITPRLDYSSIRLYSTDQPQSVTTYPGKTTVGLGARYEYFLPRLKHNWSVTVEPAFETYFGSAGASIFNYSSIELPVGIKYYYHPFSKNSFFAQTAIVPNINRGGTYRLPNGVTAVRLQTRRNAMFGVGYAYKRISIEGRWYTGREILSNSDLGATQYRKISLILGFRLI